MEEQNSPTKAYDIVKEWLEKDPQNERLLLLDDYLSNFLKLANIMYIIGFKINEKLHYYFIHKKSLKSKFEKWLDRNNFNKDGSQKLSLNSLTKIL